MARSHASMDRTKVRHADVQKKRSATSLRRHAPLAAILFAQAPQPLEHRSVADPGVATAKSASSKLITGARGDGGVKGPVPGERDTAWCGHARPLRAGIAWVSGRMASEV